MLHTPARGWRSTSRAHTRTQTHPNTPARSGGGQPKPKHKHTHLHRRPRPGVAGYKRSGHTNTPHHPSQEWRGAAETRAQAQPRPQDKRHTKVRKPSVHSLGTEAARAMQVTRPKEIRGPGMRLHPKACAAFGGEAERATPDRLGTPVPRTCMHALGTGYARKCGEPLGFRPKKRTCASTGAQPPGMTSTSR